MRFALSVACVLIFCVALSACGSTRRVASSRVAGSDPAVLVKQVTPSREVRAQPCSTPRNLGTVTGAELVPRIPSAIVLCRYGRIPGHRLVGWVQLRESVLRRLRSEFNSLRPVPPAVGFACADDNGSEIVAIVRYVHQAPLLIQVPLSGCPFVIEGEVMRSSAYVSGARLTVDLKRLIPVPQRARSRRSRVDKGH